MSPACEQTLALLDGRLSGGERAAAEQHARSCEHCRPQLEAWKRFSDGYLAQVPPVAKPSVEETRRMMRKARAAPARSARPWLMVAAAAAGAAAIAVAVVGLNRAPQTVPAMAELADGQVVPLVGDTLEGSADRGALLRVGGDRVGVAAHSRVRLARHDRERVRLVLEAGSVAASVSHRAPGQSFSVESGGFEVTVVGTRFRVERLNDGVQVDVEEGHVQVTGPGGEHFDVLAGHTLGIHGGQPAETPYAGGDFVELGGAPAAAAPAGSNQTEAAVPEEAGPTAKPRSVSASELERWRREALAGHCSAVTAEIRRAVRDNPRQAEAWRVLADCSRLTGDSRGAVSGYKRVISLASPEEADRARLLLAGVLHERLGNDSEAERVLRVYLATPKAPTLEAGARMTLARVLISLHRPAEAKHELQRVTRKLPASPQALEALEMLKTLDAR